MLSSARARRWLRRAPLLAIVLLGLLPSLALAQSPSPLAPASSSADRIADLFWIIFWTGAGVFVLVEGLILYSALRFRRRTDAQPPQIHGNLPVEIAWTTAPAIVLVVILVYTVQTLSVTRYSGQSDLAVEVIGHQWWWEFRYPALDVVTASDLHVPVGTAVRLRISSADVIHSFWIPQLFGKTDANPGLVLDNWFQATQVGVYEGQCTEYCGEQHALMRMRVVVQEPAEFDAWVRQQQQPAAAAAEVERGRQLFLSNACVGCHAIKGTAAQGRIGPDLTHFASRTEVGGGALQNAPENLKVWVGNARGVKSGVLMPPFAQSAGGPLSDADLDAVAAYLTSLK